jgi:hypothetical protein
MRSKEEYNAYMKAYMQRKRDNMTYEEWRSFRDKNNSYKMAKYHSMTSEQKEKYRNYQREKQQLYSFTKKYKQHEV